MNLDPPPSELSRLLRPVAQLADAAWRRMYLWVLALAVLYALSGFTRVRADEVAVVLRWGRVLGANPADRVHPPGALLAFPRPIDRVVRIPVRKVLELPIDALAASAASPGQTLDPVRTGYALTGDQNIVHLTVVVRYQVSDPVAWLYEGPDAETALRTEVTAALVRSLGERPVDTVLSDGRKELVASATVRAQAGLDAAHAGLAISSLELTKLDPPTALSKDFDAVQSAFIEAETARKDAGTYREGLVPKAQASADAAVQKARAEAAGAASQARGDADAFLALVAEYHANPVVVRERLYRDAIEKAVHQAGSVRFLPPPVGGRYSGLRILIPAGVASPSPPSGGSGDDG